MEARGNKTIICSVLFLDIVEYSKKSVSGQISLKERFNAFLSIAIRDVPLNDRIILDTGDGAAISFLGDISDALHAALSMRSSLLNEGVRMEPPLLVRIGVNLGPVRLVKDINGQPNIVGDGINVAQRVMSFADPGQILVSRSYYDAVSRLSQEYAGMFHYQGSRTDKHVREHEVYAIGYPGDFTSTQRTLARQSRHADAKGLDAVLFRLEGYRDISVAVLSRWERFAVEKFRDASGRQRAALIGAGVVAIILPLALAVKFAGRTEPKPLQVASITPIQMEKMAASSVAVGGQASAAKGETKEAKAPPGEIDADARKKIARKSRKAVGASPDAKEAKKNERIRTLAETTGAPAVVSLGILPWGEIYLDGRMQGVSPPLLELQVVEGQHEIRIRNTSFPTVTRIITVKSGEKIKIRHRFAN